MPKGIPKNGINKGQFKKGENKYGFKKGFSGMSGRKHKEETKIKIGMSNSVSLKGRKMADDVKRKISEANKEEKSHLWKGGISKKRGYRSFIQKRRILRTKNNGGKFTFIEWEELKIKYNFTCLCCGKAEPVVILTIDHIIPISKGGKDEKENIQPLCMACNNKKYMKVIDFRTKEELI